jgi:hypothetical protein
MRRSSLFVTCGALGLFASYPALAGNFDGTWTGKWDGIAPAKIRVSNDKVTSYIFRGQRQSLGTTSVAGKRLTFGKKYTITMTMAASGEASATYSGFGQHSTAHFVRK